MIDLKGKTISFNSHVNFEEVEEDNRLSKVTLKMCHDGINANKSEIDLQVLKRDIEKSISESVIGVPILADFKNGDFDTHTSNERVVGAISPQFSDLTFKYDDKYNRTFAYSTGYIFNFYCQNTIDILEDDDNHERAVSIEIQVLDGEYDKERKVYIIKEFVLNGITILALKVKEGMTGSRITLDYSLNDLNETLNEVFGNKMETEEPTAEITEENFSENINNQEEIKESENNMTFNKKDHALKFGLTAIQLAEEFSKACCAVKYTEEWYGDTYECTKYGFRDYDDAYVYAMDYENGYIVGATYAFEGDMPAINFADAIRMKCTYVPFNLGVEDTTNDDPENDLTNVDSDDDIVIDDYSAKEFKENNKSKFNEVFDTKVKDLETKIAEFKAIPVVEDKTEEIKTLEGKVAEFTKDIEEKNQTILDLGFKYDSLVKEKELVDEKLTNVETKISEFVNKEFKEKAKELFSKVSNGLAKEENDSLGQEIDEIKDEETFKVFEYKIKDLALARFSSIASNKENVAKFHRNPVVENIETPKEEPKDIWEKWGIKK